jgi:hypothetical protein
MRVKGGELTVRVARSGISPVRHRNERNRQQAVPFCHGSARSGGTLSIPAPSIRRKGSAPFRDLPKPQPSGWKFGIGLHGLGESCFGYW